MRKDNADPDGTQVPACLGKNSLPFPDECYDDMGFRRLVQVTCGQSGPCAKDGEQKEACADLPENIYVLILSLGPDLAQSFAWAGSWMCSLLFSGIRQMKVTRAFQSVRDI